MNKEIKKKLINDYKEQARTQTGGIYAIKNTENGKIYLGATADVAAIKNRFESGKQFDSCFHPKMNADWALYGSDAFELQIVEVIKKNETQKPIEFKEDLELLKKMWIEKYATEVLY